MGRAATTAGWAALFLCLVLAGESGADTATYYAGVSKKIDRGFCNVLGAPVLEFPYQVYSTSKEKSMLAGVTIGFGKGLVLMPLRFLSGLYDLLTFPVPVPTDFGSLIRPDYIPWVDHVSANRCGGDL